MNFTVNGASFEHLGPATISTLLAAMEANPDHTAVMINDEVIPRTKWPVVELTADDRVELVVFAGGG